MLELILCGGQTTLSPDDSSLIWAEAFPRLGSDRYKPPELWTGGGAECYTHVLRSFIVSSTAAG